MCSSVVFLAILRGLARPWAHHFSVGFRTERGPETFVSVSGSGYDPHVPLGPRGLPLFNVTRAPSGCFPGPGVCYHLRVSFLLAMLLARFLCLCNRYLVHIVYVIIVFVCVCMYIHILGFLLLWFWFYLGSPWAGGLLVSFGFCLWFIFAVFHRPGVCLCLWCLFMFCFL